MRKVLTSLLLAAITLYPALPSNAQTNRPPRVPSQEDFNDGPARKLAPSLYKAVGRVEVVVSLIEPSLAEVSAANVDFGKQGPSRQAMQAQMSILSERQNSTSALASALGAKEIARLTKGLNALILEVDATQLAQIAALPGVKSVRPVRNYKLDLSETVPYIGAATAQANGVDGSGVTVAVIDSGIDYTHRNLGGAGTDAAYAAAYGTAVTDTKNTTRDSLFPTAKVIEGMDFVGEAWPDGPLAEDTDPIDFNGHGTHVADIIAGETLSGSARTHVGVAPGAKLLAIKVCSSVASACSGVALLKAVDYLLDPNGDNDLSDHVQVANLSLGSDYGQAEDDLSYALGVAARAGVIVVASAGNGSDYPYKLGSPSSQPEVISVAQTSVPSDKIFPIVAVSTTVYGIWQAWSATPVTVSGVLTYDTTNARGCTPFAAGSLTGQIVLIDRGTCNVSVKVANAAAGGALSALIANNRAQGPGDFPPSFSFGGGDASIPGYSIRQDEGIALKSQLDQVITINPASAISIVGHMVSSSSRGPNIVNQSIKPDIGAPGGSVSAEVGTGTGETAFGGTSGAAPMVSGSAALMRQQYPTLSVPEIKSLLMNTAETEIYINKPLGLLAPITRIGGGEVRVDKALAAKTAAWDEAALTGSLSFGYSPSTNMKAFKRTVRVRNYSNEARVYNIEPTFRYTTDVNSAVTVLAPPTVQVDANGSETFDVTLIVNPTKLPSWSLNGGPLGGSGYLLQDVEFDGYLNISDATDKIHMAWHILPHKASDVISSSDKLKLHNGQASMTLANLGAETAGVDVFALTGRSSKISKGQLPKPGDNFAVIDLKYVGARALDDETLQFAIHTFRQRPSPLYPAEFDVYVDTNNDGTADYVIFNSEIGGFGTTGQGVVNVFNLTTEETQPVYFIGADFNSANMVFTVPFAALGITKDSKISFSVYAFDNYFTGSQTDKIENMVFTPSKPRYAVSGIADTGLPSGGATNVTVTSVDGGSAASPAQSGLLLLYTDGTPEHEALAVSVKK